ncbi:MAG: hypothetical protein IJ621_04655 [Paludibacteraceae bacterium]|nr:hypothetical protein [Paludibacteraceae bacterium]
MSENESKPIQKESKHTTLYVILGALVVGLIILCVIFARQRSQMQEMVEILELEKEELTDEYEDLSIQFDGYQQMDVHNDSLQEQLAIEQQRVRDLLEELRITKATNARRIAELKKELTTVRKVMVEYVRQIDSLNQTNARLTKENQHYRRENQQIVEQNTQLTEENTVLSETVTRASRLEVIDFKTTFLNIRDKKTKQFSKIHKFQFDYTLGKNTTCEPGMKTVYLRLTRPDGEVLTKSNSPTFAFEDGELQSSMAQEIEYSGEELASVMYWTVEEILYAGDYQVDFFAEGQHIGTFSFNVKK